MNRIHVVPVALSAVALGAALVVGGGAAQAAAPAFSYATDPTGDQFREGVPKNETSDLVRLDLHIGKKAFTATYRFANHRKGTTPNFMLNLYLPRAGTSLQLSRPPGGTAGVYDGTTELDCDLEVEREFGTKGVLELSVPLSCFTIEPFGTQREFEADYGDVGLYDYGTDNDRWWDVAPIVHITSLDPP